MQPQTATLHMHATVTGELPYSGTRQLLEGHQAHLFQPPTLYESHLDHACVCICFCYDQATHPNTNTNNEQHMATSNNPSTPSAARPPPKLQQPPPNPTQLPHSPPPLAKAPGTVWPLPQCEVCLYNSGLIHTDGPHCLVLAARPRKRSSSSSTISLVPAAPALWEPAAVHPTHKCATHSRARADGSAH
jgi:hypothetical protein